MDKKVLLEATPFLKHKQNCSCVTCMWMPAFLRNFKNATLEVVICAAVKTTTGEVFRGHRHGDCFRTIIAEGKKPSSSADSQGFITSKNRYVTREQGRKLQDAAGIVSADAEGYRGTTLFSEDLY